MSFADYLEAKLLNHLFSKSAFTAPTVYVGLSTADPGDNAAALAEPSGNSYARVATAAGDWSTATVGTITNANAIAFPKATGSWGTITYACLFDADTGGHLLASVALSPSKAIASNDTATFQSSSLTITLD
jgi:hypothetical protein